MSETPSEYNEPERQEPVEEINRPAYHDAGDGDQAPGPDADEDHSDLLNPPAQQD